MQDTARPTIGYRQGRRPQGLKRTPSHRQNVRARHQLDIPTPTASPCHTGHKPPPVNPPSHPPLHRFTPCHSPHGDERAPPLPTGPTPPLLPRSPIMRIQKHKTETDDARRLLCPFIEMPDTAGRPAAGGVTVETVSGRPLRAPFRREPPAGTDTTPATKAAMVRESGGAARRVSVAGAGETRRREARGGWAERG